MALETKPLMEMKTGIWINREKLRTAVDKLSMYYALFLGIMAMFNYMNENITMGIMQTVLILPLLIIQWSYSKYKKMVEKNEKK